eukprot:TRINITY_DN6498_c0_g1_i1.p1 TRINITY_DN6498_c0_g1~~TRINITY_DN6498_c0_g1_i1.p1  ORF type:complete len:207 (-),score=38.00 TRINITY_DN6498_c0_g1_i1:52-672(-)
MGFTKHNQKLLTALTKLKFSPSYNVKAMACWLRDLEMERYTQMFAKNLLVNFIEGLTILTDHTIARLIDSAEDREKMRRAVHDMKEFQLYYSATASLLQEIVMEKYAHIFAVNGVSMDLPLLTDDKLLTMGITDANDRQQILECIKKMKEELPSSAGFNSNVAPMSRGGTNGHNTSINTNSTIATISREFESKRSQTYSGLRWITS